MLLAARLMGHATSPSEAAARMELRVRFQDVLGRLEPIDREVLLLRHFEQLSNEEAAKVLGINPSAASNRHVRAIKRLKSALSERHLLGLDG